MSIPNNSNFTYERVTSDPYLVNKPQYESQFRHPQQGQLIHSNVRPITMNQMVSSPVRSTSPPLLTVPTTVHQHRPITYIQQLPVQHVQTRPLTVVHQSQPRQQIIQPRIIQQTRIVRPHVAEPQRRTEVKRIYEDDPMVETVRSSQKNYYSSYREPVRPPRETEKESKTCCAPWLLALLGLLALAGLITAIVLAANANSGFGEGQEHQVSSGIQAKPILQDGEEPEKTQTRPQTEVIPVDQSGGYTISVKTSVIEQNKSQDRSAGNVVTVAGEEKANAENVESEEMTISKETTVIQKQPVDSSENVEGEKKDTSQPIAIEPIAVEPEIAFQEPPKTSHHRLRVHK